MRIITLLFVILLSNQCSMGKQYIRLSDGAMFRGEQYATMPNRTIEDVGDGILVTYTFNFVSKSTDYLYPSSSILEIEGFGIGEDPEKPALPVRWDRFYVPSDKKYTISIVDSSYIELPVDIAPARPPMENSSFSNYTKDNVPKIKPYDGIYPQNTISTKINVYRTYPILDIRINPIRYNYQLKRVWICKKISYLIKFNSEHNEKAIINTTDPNLDPILANIVMNPKVSSRRKRLSQTLTATQITTPKYLIITVPKFLEAVNRLADWKRTQGFEVEILSRTTWVADSVISAVSNSSLIPSKSYLLLFGDFGDIPGKYKKNTFLVGIGKYKTYEFYTDYYYGCIQQNTYPDIHRGRITASSLSEANTIVDKIINYERKPNTDSSFYQKGLNCAFFQDYSNDGYEDQRFTLTSEEIRDHVVSQGKTIERVYYTFPSVNPLYWMIGGGYGQMNATPIPNELLRDYEFQWDANSQNILDGINNGAFYVFHRDHGVDTAWSAPNFSIADIELLNNGDKLPVVFSINCLTGKYINDSCFAEAFLRKADGGCAGIFAATENSLSGYNDALALGLFEAIWPNPSFIKPFPSDTASTVSFVNNPIYKLGEILDQGFADISSIYPEGTPKGILHTKEIFHCFGDPTMEIYTDVPTPFENVSITKNNGSLVVSVGEDATITFFNKSTGSIDSFYGNFITYPDDNNIRICISAHNKIPYVKEAGILYIQDETISNTITYHADQIKVGSNVTPLMPTGSVRVTNGKTTLVGETVELEGETTIELGAELEIRN